ncbi:MAG TPA: queuosine precursor transporter [Fervidobacterium sp.]|nr:queuosine precursor transporter [Fervidobacterium sp.]
MHNLLFLLLEYLVSALIILLALRFMKKEGAYVALTTLIIASNLGVAKLFNLFGMEVTAANMSMGMAFVIYSIITEVYGQSEGRKAVWIGFFAQFAFLSLGLIYTGYMPSQNDLAQNYLSQAFSLTPRIALGSWIAFLVSGYVAVWVYSMLKGKTKIWMRNNASTKIGQIVDNMIFVTIAFAGLVDWTTYFQIFLTTTLMEIALDYVDTWVVYVGIKFLKDDESNEGDNAIINSQKV